LLELLWKRNKYNYKTLFLIKVITPVVGFATSQGTLFVWR